MLSMERHDISEEHEAYEEIPEEERQRILRRRLFGGKEETPIECRRLFRFLCPKVWQDLEATNDPMIRFCSSCRRNVYFCRSREDMNKHQGECMALAYKTKETGGFESYVGEPR